MESTLQSPEFIKELFSATIGVVVTGLVGLLIGTYLEKFKNRTTRLSKRISSQPVAYSSKDEYWGHISVHHNGREIKHLNLFTVEIRNESSRDISDIIVDLTADHNSIILGSTGSVIKTNRLLLLSTEYFEYHLDVNDRRQKEESKLGFAEYSQGLKDEFAYLNGLKQYHIPVLNRKQIATFYLLVENIIEQSSVVDAVINMKSIVLEEYEDETTRQGRTFKFMFIYGMLIFALGFWILLGNFPDSTFALILCGSLGLAYSLLGLAVYQIVRLVKNWLIR